MFKRNYRVVNSGHGKSDKLLIVLVYKKRFTETNEEPDKYYPGVYPLVGDSQRITEESLYRGALEDIVISHKLSIIV